MEISDYFILNQGIVEYYLFFVYVVIMQVLNGCFVNFSDEWQHSTISPGKTL